MWKNTFLYFILGNLALLGPEGRGGGGKLVTPIISISFWFSVSHFVRMKTVWNSFENTCLINRSKDKRYQEKVWKLNLQNPPQDYWTSGHLCIVLHNLHSPTLPKPNAATCYSIVYIFWGLRASETDSKWNR